MGWFWGIYLAGVAVGLWRVDGPVPVKLMLAILWPIGPAAFVVVVAILLGSALIAFPWLGALTAGVVLLAWLL